MRKKVRSQNAVHRDLTAAMLPVKIPFSKIMLRLRGMILSSIQTQDTSAIETLCCGQLLDLLNSATEISALKGGRRSQLSSKKVIDEPTDEIAPVRFSLADSDSAQAKGVIKYLERVSGINASAETDAFRRQNASLIQGLSDEICDTIRKSIDTLTRQGVHVEGGKMEISKALAAANLNPEAVPRLAETIFRTQSAQAYNAGRWNVVNDSDIGKYIWGFEYCTVGDYRVRPEHRLLEGVRLPKDDPFWKKYFPPNGWNCRCTVLEIWNNDSEATIDYGATGKDPRKRSDEELNLMPAFAGNVGMLIDPAPVVEPVDNIPVSGGTVTTPQQPKGKTIEPVSLKSRQAALNTEAQAILETLALESFNENVKRTFTCRPIIGGHGMSPNAIGWEFKEGAKLKGCVYQDRKGGYIARFSISIEFDTMESAFRRIRSMNTVFDPDTSILIIWKDPAKKPLKRAEPETGTQEHPKNPEPTTETEPEKKPAPNITVPKNKVLIDAVLKVDRPKAVLLAFRFDGADYELWFQKRSVEAVDGWWLITKNAFEKAIKEENAKRDFIDKAKKEIVAIPAGKWGRSNNGGYYLKTRAECFAIDGKFDGERALLQAGQATEENGQLLVDKWTYLNAMQDASRRTSEKHNADCRCFVDDIEIQGQTETEPEPEIKPESESIPEPVKVDISPILEEINQRNEGAEKKAQIVFDANGYSFVVMDENGKQIGKIVQKGFEFDKNSKGIWKVVIDATEQTFSEIKEAIEFVADYFSQKYSVAVNSLHLSYQKPIVLFTTKVASKTSVHDFFSKIIEAVKEINMADLNPNPKTFDVRFSGRGVEVNFNYRNQKITLSLNEDDQKIEAPVRGYVPTKSAKQCLLDIRRLYATAFSRSEKDYNYSVTATQVNKVRELGQRLASPFQREDIATIASRKYPYIPTVEPVGAIRIERSGTNIQFFVKDSKIATVKKLRDGSLDVKMNGLDKKTQAHNLDEALDYIVKNGIHPLQAGELLFHVAEENDIPGETYGDVRRKAPTMNIQERQTAATAFTPKKSVEQLTDFMRTLGIEADYRGWSLSEANKVTEAASRFIAEFPEAGCCSIRDYDYNAYAKRVLERKSVNGDYSFADRTIRFNRKQYLTSGFPTRQAMVDSSYSSHWTSSNDEYRTISHELGHSIENVIWDKNDGSYATFQTEMETKLNELVVKQRNNNYSVLSEYGQTNWHEMLAESAASVMSSNPKQFAREVITIWEKYARH